MAIARLDRVVTSAFISRFSSLASSASGSSTSSGSASSVSLSDGLRFGAQTFATAVQNLNTSISIVNVARSTLQDLRKISDKMITLAERAAQRGVGEDTRRKLDTKFQELVTDFRQVVDAASTGDTEYLTEEGLAELFARTGLNKETSNSIAKVFSKFVVPSTDDTLASEDTIRQRPISLSPDLFRGKESLTPYIMRSESSGMTLDTPKKFAAVTTFNSVINATDGAGLLNQNDGASSVFVRDQNGTLMTQAAGVYQGSPGIDEVLAVNDAKGFTIVRSNLDLLGYNASGYEQLYVIDNSGRVVQQITSGGVDTQYRSASFSENGSSIAYAVKSGSGLDDYYGLAVKTFAIFGVDPTTVTENIFADVAAPGIATFSDVKINDLGTRVLAYDPNFGAHRFFDTSDIATVSELALPISAAGLRDVDFIDEKAIIFVKDLDTNGAEDIVMSDIDAGGVAQILVSSTGGTGIVGEFTAIEGKQSIGKTGAFAFVDGDALLLFEVSDIYGAPNAIDLTRGAGDSLDLGGGAAVEQLSLARKDDGEFKVGVLGTLPAYSVGGLELFSLTPNANYGESRYIGFAQSDPRQPLEGVLTRRPDAYRTLTDLRELKAQIEENLSALDDSIKVLEKNVTLARESGLAFLEISDQIDSADEADVVARKVRDLIRQNAREALSQAENLESVAVAALALG